MVDLTKVTRRIPNLKYTDGEGNDREVSVTLEVTDQGPFISFKAKRVKTLWSKSLLELLGEMTEVGGTAPPAPVQINRDTADVLARLYAKIMIDPSMAPPDRYSICEHIKELVKDL